jgi:hypothetical protein
MTDSKTQRLQRVQEALDTLDNAEARAALRSDLQAEPDTLAEADKLERVHRMLSSAPRERAPERLAAKIMARVSAIMQAQKSADWPVPQEAIAAAMMLANAATLPLMTGAAWLLIHAAAQPKLMQTVLPRVVAVHLMLIEVMTEVLRQAETVAEDDPQTAAAIIALLPDALRAMADQLGEE